jgi:uncharacterized membrane protein YgcG
MIKGISLLCRMILGIALLSGAALAQSTATVRGEVVDEVGAVVPGAKVALVAADGKRRDVVTDARGEFSIANVPVGVYDLLSEYPGFQSQFQHGLKVVPNLERVKLVMAVAAVNEITEVAGDARGLSTEPDQNLTGIVLDEKMIQELLPDTEEEMTEFLQALAGGTGNAQIMIDGFSGGRLPPREAIMQIRINQNLFSSEFSGGGGGDGRIEIITRPGNGQWRGNVSFGFRNSALDARNAFATTKPDLSQERYNFNVGGPLIKKRLDFNLNVDYNPTDGSGLVSATTPDGLYTTLVPAPSRSKGVSLRSGVFLTKTNMLNINYNYRSNDRTNSEFSPGGFGGGNFGGGFVIVGPGGGGGGGFGGGGGGNAGGSGSLMLPERASDTASRNHSLSFSETYVISAKLLLETRLRMQQDKNATAAVTQGLAIDVLDAFQGGGSTKSSASRSNETEFQSALTITHKRHTIKVGFQLQHENVKNLSASNFNGTYTFSTLEQYQRIINGEPGRATQFTINQGQPTLRYQQTEYSAFLQEDMRVSNALTLSAGLRYEAQTNLGDKMNFAPRVGIAYSPFHNRKTVIRAGGGMFLSRLNAGTYANTLRYDNQTQQTITIFNPVYYNPLPPDLSLLNPINLQQQNTTRLILDPNLQAPYTTNGMLSVEQQLPKALVASFGYNFNRGIHLFRTRNINAPIPGTGLRPDPTQGNINATESAGKSMRQEMSFGLSRRFSSKLFFFSNYRLAWANDDSAFPANNYDLKPEWARSSNDRRHMFNTTAMISLPWGLRVNPSLFMNAGAPFNITTGLDDNFDTQFNDRPSGISRNSDLPTSLYSSIPRPDRIVTIDGKSQTLIDYLYSAFPNGIRAEGPATVGVNLGVNKVFGFGARSQPQQAQNGRGNGGGGGGGGGGRGQGGGGGFGGGGGGFGGGPMMMGGGGRTGAESSRYQLRLSVNISNLFNHVNFNQYGGVLGSPYLGRPSSAAPARAFNFNMAFSF